MKTQKIEDLIVLDLQTFLNLKNKDGVISINEALEIASYVSANFLQIIYTKNKKIEKHEINGVFGIVSDFFNSHFEGEITNEEFHQMTQNSLQLLQKTEFSQMSKAFFNEIISKQKNN